MIERFIAGLSRAKQVTPSGVHNPAGNGVPIDMPGLRVFASEYYEKVGAAFPLVDENGSSDMAIDASFSGTPEAVYSDSPTTGWTNTALTGTWDFASTSPVDVGTHAIDATATVNGDQMQIERSSSLDLTSYSAVTGRIQLDSYNDSKDSVLLEFRLAGILVGNEVNLNTYIDTTVTGSFQTFVIPKEDLGLDGSTIDQLVFTTISASGQPPNYHLDELKIQETGSKVFTFAPPRGVIFEVDNINYIIRNNITDVEPDTFMGETLTNGFRVRTQISGVTTFGATFKTLEELMFGGGRLDGVIASTTQTLYHIIGPSPAPTRFIGDNQDTFSFVLSDAFNGLSAFRVSIRGSIIKV